MTDLIKNIVFILNQMFLVSLTFLVFWYLFNRFSRKNYFELAEKIPGPKGLPLLGNALEFTGSSHGENLMQNSLKSDLNYLRYFQENPA